MAKFFARLVFKLIGWKLDPIRPPGVDRCVMIAAPHTSNWDIIITKFAFILMDIPLRFTIKREWMRFPLSLVIRPMGGIAIDRRPKKPGDPRPSMVEAMADLFKKRDNLAVLVTPEGTRKRVEKWRSGFYHTAVMAEVPICFGYLDYGTKTAGVGGHINPTGDYDKDLQAITAFYKERTAKFPQKFSVDVKSLETLHSSQSGASPNSPNKIKDTSRA